MLHKVQIDPSRTNWVASHVEKYSLFDEHQLFQLGYEQETQF